MYQLTPGDPIWTAKILHTFCSEANCADGKNPAAKLLPVSHDVLYGTTFAGGAENGGTIFELRRVGGSWAETVLHDFCSGLACIDGRDVLGGVPSRQTYRRPLRYDFCGGTSDRGVAYTLAKDGSSFQVIHNFCAEGGNCLDGATPAGELRRRDGTFFGVTYFGGDTYDGTVFQLRYVHGHWVFTSLHGFQCSDGCTPVRQQLAMDAQGNLFGTTAEGGQFSFKGGTVFELSP